jgi:hypothetical protein
MSGKMGMERMGTIVDTPARFLKKDFIQNIRRVGIVFALVAAFALTLRFVYPTAYFDNKDFDYNATSASHAILAEERAAGTPNSGNLNINSHPGIPYYLFMGFANQYTQYIAGGDGLASPEQRIVNFFKNIELFWSVQGVFAALLAAFGAALLTMYCREAPVPVVLVLFALPLAFMHGFGYTSSYCYDLLNETFALPVAALFLLTAHHIFTTSANQRLPWLFVMLGFVAGIAYSVKLPYLSLFFSGFVVAPLLCGVRRASWRTIIGYSAFYVFGFAFLFVLIGSVMGFGIIKNWLLYHYNVLTHAGFAGGGDSGIITGITFKTNLFRYIDYMIRIWLSAVFSLLLIVAIYIKKLQVRWRHCALLLTMLSLHSLVVVKHWSDHYALLCVIICIFCIYEILFPFLRLKKQKLTACLLAVLFVCVAIPDVISLNIFTNSVDRLHRIRASKNEFIDKIQSLPIQPGEAVYFQWGTHKLPIYSINFPLDLTYFADRGIAYRVSRYFFPDIRFQTSVTYPIDKDRVHIRYIVMARERFDKQMRIDTPVEMLDMPHPRMVTEPSDTIVLEWKEGGLLVIEKALPIDPMVADKPQMKIEEEGIGL